MVQPVHLAVAVVVVVILVQGFQGRAHVAVHVEERHPHHLVSAGAPLVPLPAAARAMTEPQEVEVGGLEGC
jgi:hypothetical protein